MKRFFAILSVMAAVGIALGSCNKETDITDESANFPADGTTLQGSIPETKVSLDGLDVKWSEGDVLCVASDTDFEKHEFTLASGAGEKTATFEAAKGIEDGTKFIAYYPASIIECKGSTSAGQKTGLWYFNFNIPKVQSYVPDNVASNLLFMRAAGTDLQNMQFQQMLGILRFKLYAESAEPVTVSNITLTNLGSKVLCGPYYDDYINYTTQTGLSRVNFSPVYGNNDNLSVVLDNIETQLSNDPSNPTVFNFVVTPGVLSGFELRVEDSKGSYMTKIKPSSLTLSAGKIETFPALAYTPDSPLSENAIIYSVDGGEPTAYTGADIPTPTSSLSLTTKNGAVMTAALLSKVIKAINSAENTGSIDLDLSGIQYMSPTFPANFKGNRKLRSISLPGNIQTIADSAFESCTLSSVTMPEGLTTIGNYAFSYSNIQTLRIPAGISKIGWFQLRNATYSKAFDVDPDNEAYSSLDGNLYNKDQTILIDYPKGKTETSFTVPDGVKTIYDYALMETRLETLTIPASVTRIASSALQADIALATIICEGTVPPTMANMSKVATSVTGKKVIRVPQGCKEAYEVSAGWKYLVDTYGFVIEDGSVPAPASAAIAPLSEDDTYTGNTSFWK